MTKPAEPQFFIPRTIDALEEPGIQPSRSFRVKTARVVFADYDKLQLDFPHLRAAALKKRNPRLRELQGSALTKAVRKMIDAWLLRHGALISEAQANQVVVNRPIDVSPEPVVTYRPPRYGRASVVSLRESNQSLPPDKRSPWANEPDGLLDLKGSGARSSADLRGWPNSYTLPGLHLLGDAIAEYIIGALADAAFRHAGTQICALPHYAIIDLGFDDKHGRPVGMLVRRAHRRHPEGLDHFFPIGSVPYRAAVIAEMVLRSYGITSVVRGGAEIQVRKGRVRWRVAGVNSDRVHSVKQARGFLELTAAGAPEARMSCINMQTSAPIQDSPPSTQVCDLECLTAVDSSEVTVMMPVGNRVFRWGGALAPDHPAFVRRHPRNSVDLDEWGPRDVSERESEEFYFEGVRQAPGHLVVALRLAKAWRTGQMNGARIKATIDSLIRNTTRRWSKQPASDAMHASADALFESAATTGARLLALEENPRTARLTDAAESLLALGELDSLVAAPTAGLAENHRILWAARRWMAGEAMGKAERRLERLAARAAKEDAGALHAALHAARRLRAPAGLTRSEIRQCAKQLRSAAPIVACIEQWISLLNRA